MSQILLYITLIVAAPSGAANAYELSFKGNVEDIVLTASHDQTVFSQIAEDPRSDTDLLANETNATLVDHFCSICSSSLSLSFSSPQHSRYSIRAPPVVS